MAGVRRVTTLKSGRASDLAGWLFVLLTACAALGWCRASLEDRGTGAGEEDHPFAQIACADRAGPVWGLAFSPDGRRLASSTITGELWVEDVRTGGLEWGYRRPVASVFSLTFSPEGRLLAATGNDRLVKIWNAASGAEVPGLEVGGRTIAFSRDGRTLAVGCYDGSVILRDRKTGRSLATLAAGHSGVSALDFSPDGRRLAAGGADGLGRVWDTACGRELATLDDHAPWAPLTGVHFSPDRRWLATIKAKARVVHLWDPETCGARGSLPASGPVVNAIAFSPEADVLATAQGDGAVVFWDPVARRRIGELLTQKREILSLAFSGDGRILATGGVDGRVRLWDVRQALERHRAIERRRPPDFPEIARRDAGMGATVRVPSGR